VCLSLAALLISASPAISHEVAPEDAAQPVRMIAYVLHPVGYVLYQGVVRPLHGLASLPVMRDLFGHKEDVFEQKIWEPNACGPPANMTMQPAPQLQETEGQAVPSEGALEGQGETAPPMAEPIPEEESTPEMQKEIAPVEQPAKIETTLARESIHKNFQPRKNKIGAEGK
jgi:hypothetical protein